MKMNVMQVALVVTNLFLLADVYHSLTLYSGGRSTNIERFVREHTMIDNLLAQCIYQAPR